MINKLVLFDQIWSDTVKCVHRHFVLQLLKCYYEDFFHLEYTTVDLENKCSLQQLNGSHDVLH